MVASTYSMCKQKSSIFNVLCASILIQMVLWAEPAFDRFWLKCRRSSARRNGTHEYQLVWTSWSKKCGCWIQMCCKRSRAPLAFQLPCLLVVWQWVELPYLYSQWEVSKIQHNLFWEVFLFQYTLTCQFNVLALRPAIWERKAELEGTTDKELDQKVPSLACCWTDSMSRALNSVLRLSYGYPRITAFTPSIIVWGLSNGDTSFLDFADYDSPPPVQPVQIRCVSPWLSLMFNRHLVLLSLSPRIEDVAAFV